MNTGNTSDEAQPAPLAAWEVLDTVELGRFGLTLGPSGEGQWSSDGKITFGWPVVHPLKPDQLPDWLRAAPDALAWCYNRLAFPFELHEPGARRAYVDATFRVRLNCETVAALDLEPPRPVGPGGLLAPLPLRGSLGDGTQVLPSQIDGRPGGYGQPAFHWTLTDPLNGVLSPTAYMVSAVLRVPSELTILRGELRAQARIRKNFLGRLTLNQTVTPRPSPFETPLIPPRVQPPAPAQPSPKVEVVGVARAVAVQDSPPKRVRRLCLAVDVESYSRRNVQERVRVQRRLLEVLDKAAAGACLVREDWDRQPEGDGELALLPPGLDEPGSIDEFLHALRVELALLNEDLTPKARLRLRLAFAEGVVQQAPNGYAGDAVIAVCRMRDSDLLREALRDHPRANAVVAVSDAVYQGLAGAGLRHLRPDAFQKVTVSVKEFQAGVWILVLPG